MTIDKAIDLLRKEHARAESLPYVHKPVAWALYQVWKKADQEKERPSAAAPGNVEPCACGNCGKLIYPQDGMATCPRCGMTQRTQIQKGGEIP